MTFLTISTLTCYVADRHYRKSLTWTQRIEAAIGVAKGIQYLHTGIVPGVYSNNLKITDVLLDQNFVAKIKSYDQPLLSLMRKVCIILCSFRTKNKSCFTIKFGLLFCLIKLSSVSIHPW